MKNEQQTIHLIQTELELLRPPENIRKELDYGFSFEYNTLILYEIRPKWDDKSVLMKSEFAKAKFIISKNIWKLYWMRVNLKWYAYEPKPEVKTLKNLFKTIREDKFSCFFG